MGTDKTRFRVWSEGKEFEHYADCAGAADLVSRYDSAFSISWIWVWHFGYKSLIRWNTVTRVELAYQNVDF